jgi:thiamine-phosphate pyrophosphorylase
MISAPDFSLYLIIDSGYLSKIKKSWNKVLVPALKAGVTAVQLRCKELNKNDFISLAFKIQKITKKYRVPLIINDNVLIAKTINAGGVHIGTCDMPVKEARRLLGKNKIIGVSASTAKEARAAAGAGADYIGLGPVYKTKNKNARPIPRAALKKMAGSLRLPVVAIGGIKEYNINVLKKAGIKNFCFISGISGAKNIFKKVKRLKELINDPA